MARDGGEPRKTPGRQGAGARGKRGEKRNIGSPALQAPCQIPPGRSPPMDGPGHSTRWGTARAGASRYPRSALNLPACVLTRRPEATGRLFFCRGPLLVSPRQVKLPQPLFGPGPQRVVVVVHGILYYSL